MRAGFRVKVEKRDHYPLSRNTRSGENQGKSGNIISGLV